MRLKNKARSVVNVFWEKNASNLDNFLMVTADSLFTEKIKKESDHNDLALYVSLFFYRFPEQRRN